MALTENRDIPGAMVRLSRGLRGSGGVWIGSKARSRGQTVGYDEYSNQQLVFHCVIFA